MGNFGIKIKNYENMSSKKYLCIGNLSKKIWPKIYLIISGRLLEKIMSEGY